MFPPFFLSLVFTDKWPFLQTSALCCTRLKFDYQMAVYELYGDVLVMNCYCVSSFFSISGFYRQMAVFTDKFNILHESEV